MVNALSKITNFVPSITRTVCEDASQENKDDAEMKVNSTNKRALKSRIDIRKFSLQ